MADEGHSTRLSLAAVLRTASFGPIVPRVHVGGVRRRRVHQEGHHGLELGVNDSASGRPVCITALESTTP